MPPLPNQFPVQRKIEVIDNGEKLWPIRILEAHGLFIDLALYKGVSEASSSFLREGVIDRLIKAQKYLEENHKGMHIVIRSAFRDEAAIEASKKEIEERFDQEAVDGKVEGLEKDKYVRKYLAVPGGNIDPGHMTGGAVDVRLCDDDGNIIHLEIPSDEAGAPSRTEQRPTHSEVLMQRRPDLILKREILLKAMESQGFVNNSKEYWHFSYGDQEWAAKLGEPHAIYGIVKTDAKK